MLGVTADVSKLLPLDDVKGHFDNDATSLQVSPAFIDQYVSAAREIAKQAVGDIEAPPVTTTYGDIENMVISLNPRAAPGTGRQQHHIEGMPFGTRGGFTVKHWFPADGEYELTIGDMAMAREVPKMEFENTVLALLDGKEFYRTNIGGERDHKAIDTRLDVAVAEINGRLRKIRFKATAGHHDLTVTFVHRSYAESDERVRATTLEGGQERIQAVHALQIRGPLEVTGISDSSPSRKKIFTCKPKGKADETCLCEQDRQRSRAAGLPSPGDPAGCESADGLLSGTGLQAEASIRASAMLSARSSRVRIFCIAWNRQTPRAARAR